MINVTRNLLGNMMMMMWSSQKAKFQKNKNLHRVLCFDTDLP